MLSQEDKIKLQELTESNPDFKIIVNKMIEEQAYTLSKFSHEIRNPLTLINSSLQIIEAQHPEVADFKYWEETLNDLKYLRLLLDDLSSYNNGSHLNITSINIVELVQSICVTFKLSMDNVNKCFRFRCDKNIPLIEGDPVKIRQAILNILKNAMDATEENGCISLLLACPDASHIQVNVTDNGCGIPEEYHSTLFCPFVTHKTNGTGLGLAIAMRVAEAHNGTLTFSSASNKGTKFSLILPIIQVPK